MSSVITYIYNKKTKGPTYINGIVHSHRKTEIFFFFKLEIFDVPTRVTRGAHIENL
jgi:hypothetical protein